MCCLWFNYWLGICCFYIVSRKSLLKSMKKYPPFDDGVFVESWLGHSCSCEVGGGINTENAAEYLEAGLGHLNFCYTPGSTNIAGWKIRFNSSPLKNDGWKTFAFPFGARPLFLGAVTVKLPGCNKNPPEN